MPSIIDNPTGNNSRCDNCGRIWTDEELNEPKDLTQRLDAGSECPSGECPECGALCYVITEPLNVEE